MVFPSEVHGVNIHATIVGPVIGKGNDELHASFGSTVDDFVEAPYIDLCLSILPCLQHDICLASALSSVVG